MFIYMKRVRQFTNLQCSATAIASRVTPDILSLRNLRNKHTPHTNPVVTIDHGQTAMLALLNGIRSAPTIATPMPAGFRNNPEGGSYGNDKDYDARAWGYKYPNASISPEDFRQQSSLKVRQAITAWVVGQDYSAVVKQGFELSYVERIRKELWAQDEACRKEMLDGKMEEHSLQICMCGDACNKGSALCPTCTHIVYQPLLTVKKPNLDVEISDDC